ncbi:MAG: thiamine pyrophosphate-binding protein [Alphaproteobacteria bacterium]|nr:thiamine pyrophosphate-binding protein [Alphaproteobacteria bacterium]
MSADPGNQFTGAEAFVRMLQHHGVKHVFGLCGDTTLPLYDALYRLDHGIAHVLTRDERSAAYMADGYARVSGRVGVCEGPSGGGATYLLPGLAEANESSIAVLGINSDISVAARGRFALTELDQAAMFRPVTKWNAMIDRAADIPETLRRAFREMTTGRPGAVHLGLPFDVQNGPVPAGDVHAEARFGAWPAERVTPDRSAIEAAASAMSAAKNPIIVCGGGVAIAGGQTALLGLAVRLGCPVATSISGRGAIPDAHPLSLGVVGSNGGTAETREAVDAADLVIFVGCRAGSVTTERWRHPDPTTARVIHIDVDERVFGANYDPVAAVHGDAANALAAIDGALMAAGFEVPERRLGIDAVAALKRRKFAAFDALAASSAAPILPERLVAALQRALPADCVVVADPGTPCPYLSAYLRIDPARQTVFSNRAHGALGYAMAAATGAYFGRPDAKPIAVMGDGSFGFCCGELETLVRLNVPVTMIVVSNAVYGWIKAGQKSGYEGRYYSVDFDRTDHARVAEAFGVKSWRVEDPAELDRALAAAIAHDGPSLVDVICQPLQEANAPVSEWVA